MSTDDSILDWTEVHHSGTTRHYRNGVLHKDGAPAIEWSSGSRHYYQRGLLHRDGGPAIEDYDGERAWYCMGQVHRVDGPARISADGTQEWFLNNKQHRVDGPAVIYPDGTQRWCLYGCDRLLVLAVQLLCEELDGCWSERAPITVNGYVNSHSYSFQARIRDDLLFLACTNLACTKFEFRCAIADPQLAHKTKLALRKYHKSSFHG